MEKSKIDYDVANGKHYKKGVIREEHLGQPVDPAFIASFYPLTAMQFTALKKILAAGDRGNKSYLQDITDAIKALERDIQLEEVKNLILANDKEKPF